MVPQAVRLIQLPEQPTAASALALVFSWNTLSLLVGAGVPEAQMTALHGAAAEEEAVESCLERSLPPQGLSRFCVNVQKMKLV